MGAAIWGGAIAQSWCRPFLSLIGSAALIVLGFSTRKHQLIVLACALALGASILSLRQLSLTTNIVHHQIGRAINLRAQVVTDPHRMSQRVYGSTRAPTTYSFIARALDVDHRYHTRIPVRMITQSHDVLPGQIVSGRVRVLASREGRVAALVIAQYLTIETQPSRWARSLAAIRAGLRTASGGGDSGALIPGMVLGDTSLQSDRFQLQMRRAGLTHLVAVSGANFAIVSAFVLWLMSFLVRTMRLRLAATSLALVAFIALVRPSPSVLRAAAMAAVMLYAKAHARRKDSIPALGFAIAAVIIADPWQSRDPGFALSVLATAGLILLAPRIKGPIAEPIAAMIFCAPITIALSGFISPMSILANVAAAPVVAPITVGGFVAALISPLSPRVAHLLVLPIKPLAWWIVQVAQHSASVAVISISAVVFIALGCAIFLFNRRAAALVLLIALGATYFVRFPSGDWDVVQCDVGQGDALVVRTPHHHSIVIDTGPDPDVMDRCLTQLHIRSIDLIIITHPHADHEGGLPGAVRGRSVGAIWRTVIAGTHTTIDGVSLDVLWPRDRSAQFRALPGDGSAINNTSIAVLLRHPDFSLFAAGDLEPPAQVQIHPPRVDIYKVSHHGSRYQDRDFTAALHPAIALISVGKGNSYGHPAKETLSLLRSVGARVLRTDRDGAIALDVHAGRITVRNSAGGFRLWRWS